MQTIVEYAPTALAIIAAGIFGVFIIAAFRAFGPRRKVSDDYRSQDEPTMWVLGWNRKPNPIRPDQLTVYTGSARLQITDGKTVEAEVVSYEDERTRLVTR